MDQETWEKVNTIVDTALNLKGEERATYIQKKCSGNQELRHEVTKLLVAIERSKTEEFLDDAGTIIHQIANEIAQKKQRSYASSLIGVTIDKYKITELIGHGGMGSVFLAERADEAYNQQVALKIMRRGMDTPSNIARFKRERNILARLDHPNIARLLDGGVTADGLPYLVMDYINGVPLMEYCDTHKLSIDERLSLFQSVCEAVQHAHRNAIIHRDLKPSNIYITGDGTVKVLDFGIAKLIESDANDLSSFQTQTGSRFLTFGYAAPEQVENKAVTTSTDSYALGILLYEILAGIHPFNLDGKDLSTMEDLIRNYIPDKPSGKFSNLSESQKTIIVEQRSTDPSDLSQILAGDLDALVMKALRKEPEARYNSVDQMLEDLNRYHQSRPLIAQSDTFRYKTKKFITRNRNSVVGAFLILTTFFGFGSYHVNQIADERNIAEKEAQKAETVKGFLIDIFGSANPGSASFEGKNISAQQILMNGQNRIGENLQNQPDVYTEVLLAVGDALSNIDAFEEAEKSYRQALTNVTETSEPLKNKTQAYVKLGNLQSRWTKDEEALAPALKAQKSLRNIENPPPALEASVYSLLGKIHVFIENYDEAKLNYEQADSIYVSAGLRNSFDYIQMLSGYGKLLIYQSNYKKAEQVLDQSNKLHRKAFADPTMTLAENFKFLGWASRDLGNFEKSNDYFLQSIDLYSRLTGEGSIPTALSMYHLSINYTLSADFEEAEKLAKEVLSIYQKQLDPSNDHIQRPKKYIAIAKYQQNQLAEAQNLLQELIQERTKYRGENNIGLAGPYSHMAVIHKKNKNYEKALSALDKSIAIYKRELGENSIRTARAMIKLASLYRDMGKYDLAHKYFKKTETIHQQVLPKNNHQNADFHFEYGKLMRDMDKPQKAQQYLQKSYAIYSDIFGSSNNQAKKLQSYF